MSIQRLSLDTLNKAIALLSRNGPTDTLRLGVAVPWPWYSEGHLIGGEGGRTATVTRLLLSLSIAGKIHNLNQKTDKQKEEKRRELFVVVFCLFVMESENKTRFEQREKSKKRKQNCLFSLRVWRKKGSEQWDLLFET